MDVLESGRDRPPSRAAVLLHRLPARAVGATAAVVLVGGLLGVGEVQRAQREADDVSAVVLHLVVEATRRAGDGSAYGFARLEVDDPAGRPVTLLDVDVDIPGLRFGRQGLGVADLEPAPALVLPLRFAVPECGRLRLPGRLTARVARPARPPGTVQARLDDAAQVLRRGCGLPPSDGAD